ncbi:MAG: 50S ribosomal protein L25 [Bacillota bacterium]
MTEYHLEASVRKNMTKSYRKSLYGKGMVPAVLYGKNVGNVPLEVPGKELQHALHTGRNTIINLEVAGNGGPYKVMVRDLQYDPLKKEIIHADFQQISMHDRIHTSVPVVIRGEVDGGMARPVLRRLEISCLPADIPDQITVDISGMKPGDSLSVIDLGIPEGINILSDEDATVVTVLSPDADAVEVAPKEAAETEGAVNGDEEGREGK